MVDPDGRGLLNPVDDLGPERAAKAPEVIDALASEWAKGGYDLKWLFRTIMNSRAYQREVRSTDTAAGRTPFAAVCPTRLRSDQIIDSLAQALDLPLDGRGQGQGKNGAIAKDLKMAVGKDKGMARGRNPRSRFNALFGVDPSAPYDDILGTIPQTLFLMNSPQINNAIAAKPRTVLGQILLSTPDNHAALNALYLRVLARAPKPEEVKVCSRYIQSVGNRAEAFEDILWALINSTEFITRR